MTTTVQLRPREQRVLEMTAAGCSQREIAGRLGIGRSAVRRFQDALQQRLNTANLPHAVAVAARYGLIDLDTIPGGPH